MVNTVKATTCFFLLLVVTQCLVSASSNENTTVNPGLLVRLTKQTFDYVTNIAVKQIIKDARNVRIPDQHGRAGIISYDIYNMKINNFGVKSHSVTFLPNQVMKYKFAGIGFDITGRVGFKTLHFIHMHSSFKVAFSEISSSMNLNVALDPSSGRLTAVIGGCNRNVPAPSVTFYSHQSILRFVSKRVGSIFQQAIQNQMCSSHTINTINVKLAKALQQMPTSETFLTNFILDFRMLKNPDINTTFMDTAHKGEVFWSNNRKECPLPVRPMEPMPTATTAAMVALQLSAYTLNTFSYVAYKNKYFHYIFDSKNIPKDGLLNTTCQNICIGKLIPELAKAYPNKQVSILLEATEMPEPNIDKGYFMLDGTVGLTIYLSTDSPNKPLIILPIKVHTISTATIGQGMVHYNISVLKLKLGLVKKGLPIKINIEQLQHTINFGINAFVMPRINRQGNIGFPLPQLSKEVKTTNTQFKFGINSAILMTDFTFDVNFESAEDGDRWFRWLIRSIGYPGYQMMSSIVKFDTSNLSLSS